MVTGSAISSNLSISYDKILASVRLLHVYNGGAAETEEPTDRHQHTSGVRTTIFSTTHHYCNKSTDDALIFGVLIRFIFAVFDVSLSRPQH